VHCNTSEGSCILCQAGIPATKKYLTPVFSIESGDIKILPISPSLEPFALLPQWVNIFKNKGSRHLLSIVREGNFKYFVSLLEFEEGMKVQILPVIKEFMAMVKEGEVDIGSAYPSISNKTLAGVPEIMRILTAKGITLKADDPEGDV
jgi:hypothetical protein